MYRYVCIGLSYQEQYYRQGRDWRFALGHCVYRTSMMVITEGLIAGCKTNIGTLVFEG